MGILIISVIKKFKFFDHIKLNVHLMKQNSKKTLLKSQLKDSWSPKKDINVLLIFHMMSLKVKTKTETCNCLLRFVSLSADFRTQRWYFLKESTYLWSRRSSNHGHCVLETFQLQIAMATQCIKIFQQCNEKSVQDFLCSLLGGALWTSLPFLKPRCSWTT